MPLYEYACVHHGVFEAHRPMAESADDGECPVCFQGSARILSPLNLRRMAASQVKAMDRNERSQHEPRLVHTAPRAAGPGPLRAAGWYPWAIGH
jgi:putative FmdB family regulatory protein